MIPNYPSQYRRKTLANTFIKSKSLLDIGWEKVLEAGGFVPEIVMNRLSMYKRTQSQEPIPTQVIERKKLTRENVTIVPRSFVFKTEKIKHEYFQVSSRIFKKPNIFIENISNIEDESDDMDESDVDQDIDIVILKENQEDNVEGNILNDVVETKELKQNERDKEGIVLKQNDEEQNVNKDLNCNKLKQQTTQLTVFPKCFDISQYNSFEQLIISKRKGANKLQTNQKRCFENIKTIVQLQTQCDQIHIRQQLGRILSKNRNDYYDFQVCKCGKKHTILYYKEYKVPSLFLKKYLIFDHFKSNQFDSVKDLVLKIEKLGFKWHIMQKQIGTIINLGRIQMNLNEKKYFKSYIFRYGKYQKQNNNTKVKVFNFSKCIKFNDYSLETQKCALLYLTSKQITRRDKIMRNPQVKIFYEKYKSTLQYPNVPNKENFTINQFEKLFQRFSVSKCCECKDNHFVLKYLNKIVPSLKQKNSMLTYFLNLYEQRIKTIRYLKKYIKKSILTQGYNWKFINKDIDSFSKTSKIQSLQQEFKQTLSNNSQCESDDSKSCISQKPLSQRQLSSESIFSTLKPIQQEINLKVFPECFDVSEYNPYEQLLITNSVYTKKQKKNNKRQQENIQKIIQLEKNTLFKSLSNNRLKYYDFKVCGCKQKHTVLYYQHLIVPSLQLKKYLIFDHFKTSQFISLENLIQKIKKLGFSWHCMEKEIIKIIDLPRNQFEGNEIKFLKSYFIKGGNYRKQNNYTSLFNFSKCIELTDYSERQRCALLYLTSNQVTKKDKIQKNTEIKRFFEKYKLILKNPQNQYYCFISLFNRFSILKCCDCKNNHFILNFMNKIVPSLEQKNQLLTYFKNIYQQKVTNFQNLKVLIKKNILLQGYDWKFIDNDISSFIEINKIVSSQQEFDQTVSCISQSESDISNNCISQQSQSQNNISQENIFSPLKPVEQEIAESREKILKKTRKSKLTSYQNEKKTKRQRFIRTYTAK